MTTKLHINISQGIIDVEGDPELVRTIYNDFKEQLLAGATVRQPLRDEVDEAGITEENVKPRAKGKRRPSAKKRAAGDDAGPIVIADSPKLDKNLDTSGLVAFYEHYEASNNPQKILVFLKFMNDELGIDNPNTDQFYTCFEKVNARVPKVFSQAFRDASGRNFGFIDYNSATDIKITTVGSNYFKFDLKKKGAE
ncbi:hypothetical protein [Devosia sp.]|uniref:hypothetical protein n=1 Tax=Devosia sp. TaxID=1871048 RepID=UPI002FCB1B45